MAASAKKRKAGGKAPAPASRPWIFPAILFTLALLIYAPALNGPFVLDDFDLAEGASAVRVGGLEHLIGSGRPLLMASFIANHRLAGGFDPFAFHLANVLLHGLNAVLLWLLAKRLFGPGEAGERLAPSPSLLIYFLPLLFLTSPIQTESAAYISSRSEVLAATFYIGGLLVFAARREKNPWITAAAVMGCFAGAALSKQDKLTLPFVLLLLDYLVLSGLDWRGLKRNWPTYGLFAAGVAAGAAFLVRPVLFARSAGFSLDWTSYLFTQFRMYFRYLGQLVLPIRLNLDPDIAVSNSLGEHGAGYALVGLIAILAATAYFHRRSPLIAFGTLFFFVALAPTTSFFPLLDHAAERRLYLPSIGFLIVLLVVLPRLFDRRSMIPRVAAAVLAAAYCLGTYQRAALWSDDLALWRDTVEKSPEKARPWTWLGRVYDQRGAVDQARAAWLKAAELVEPGSDEEAYLLGNLGLAEARAKRYEQAIAYYLKAISIVPDDPRLWAQLAVARMRAGREEEGWKSFERGFASSNDVQPESLKLRAQELYRVGRYEEAARDYELALRLRPDDAEAQRNLEIARRAAGK